jgi:hypothetical protein
LIKTEFARALRGETTAHRARSATPLRRLGEPIDIAGCGVSCLTRGEFHHRAVIVADGVTSSRSGCDIERDAAQFARWLRHRTASRGARAALSRSGRRRASGGDGQLVACSVSCGSPGGHRDSHASMRFACEAR